MGGSELHVEQLDLETGEARLSSIVRDLYVQLPLIGWPNRINAAYVFGGPYYTMKTVNETFGLNIRKYCTIDLRGFTSVVDLLGGVEIENALLAACGRSA